MIELTDILLREQCETSNGYWHKHKLQEAVYYPNLSFGKSILRAINSPLLFLETKSSSSSSITATR